MSNLEARWKLQWRTTTTTTTCDKFWATFEPSRQWNTCSKSFKANFFRITWYHVYCIALSSPHTCAILVYNKYFCFSCLCLRFLGGKKNRDKTRNRLFGKTWIVLSSVTRLGNLFDFGQLFKACGNKYFAQIYLILKQFCAKVSKSVIL